MLFLACLFACLMALPAGLAASLDSPALAGWPNCSIACLETILPDSSCSATDQMCMCTDEKFQVAMTACVKQECTVKESLVTKNLTMTNCGAPIRDKSHHHIVISITLVVLSGLSVVQRFVSKLYWKLPLGPDDWSILITFLTGIPSTVITVHGTVANGLGRDMWTLTPDEITRFIMFFHIMGIIYYGQVALLKQAFLFFHLRIFPSPGVRRVLWATVIFNSLVGVTFVFATVFQCQPITYLWVMWDGEHEGRCADVNAIAWSNAAISIALDFWILAIPLSQLKSLNLDWKKKIGVGIMFGVGIFVTIVSILRLRTILNFRTNGGNETWDFVEFSEWSTIEIGVGIICACMPSMRIPFVRLFPKIFGTSRQYSHSYAGATAESGTKKRPLGTNATSEADRARRSVEPWGITYQRSYDVQFGDDDDETRLVDMKNSDGKSTRSKLSV